MWTESQMKSAIQELRPLIAEEDLAALDTALHQIGLCFVLGTEFIDYCRLNDESAMVNFLATLAAHNTTIPIHEIATESKHFLHVGCGPLSKGNLKGFNSDQWHEIKLDIDVSVKPDIVGTLTDMKEVHTNSVDAIYSSHNIEHLYAHEVPIALLEFHRVLKCSGMVVLTCPDLQSVCEAVVADNLYEPLYISTAGPISPIDILYGHRAPIERGNFYMAHKSGFTYSALCDHFMKAGFKTRIGMRRSAYFDLWLVAFKDAVREQEAIEIAEAFLP